MTAHSSSTGFRFFAESFSDLVLPHDPGLLIARVSSRIRQKYQLFQTLKLELKLPDYFGSNWDALEECLCDFSWLVEYQGVDLIHAGLPFHAGHRSRALYLQILQSAVTHWNADPRFRLRVQFPERDRPEITRLLRKSKND